MSLDKKKFLQLAADHSKATPSGCIEWTRCRTESGYGLLTMGGANYYAHRSMWVALKGDLKEGDFVCHKCDNRACINIDHLFLGDAKINYADMYLKGRKGAGPKGSKQHNATLIVEEVQFILEGISIGMTDKEMAKILCVSTSCVNCVRRGSSWNHITKLPKYVAKSGKERIRRAKERNKAVMQGVSA